MTAPTDTDTATDEGGSSGLATADDWAAAVETATFPTVETGTSQPTVVDSGENDSGEQPTSSEKRFINTSYLAHAANWMPLDYSIVDTPSIALLTSQHKERAKGCDTKLGTSLSISYATTSLIAGLLLNLGSWTLAAASTALNRGLVSGDQWRSEEGRPLRPRHLSVITADNARRAAAIDNRFVRSLFIVAACVARMTGMVLNLGAYTLARLAVTINDPERMTVAAIPASIATIVTLAVLIA